MPELTAPVLGDDAASVALDESIFGAEVKPHLIHETVRAEAAATRAGTHAAKSRGLVSGGGSKPWRQKGTGRARAGTTRAPQWTGGGVAFPPEPRSHELKVNRKARRAALRGALAAHARAGSLAVVTAAPFAEASTKRAAELVSARRLELPLLLVAMRDEEGIRKSFRNLERVLVVEPSELEVAALVWARSLLLTRDALALVQEAAR